MVANSKPVGMDITILLVRSAPVTEKVWAADAVPTQVANAVILPDFVILGPATVNATEVAQPANVV